jgi:penicillin-binding protein 1A
MAKSLGVHSELPAVPSLALGSAEVTLIEMVRAMAAIATNTKSIEPYAVRTIRAEAAPLYTRPETPVERPEWNRTAMMPLLEAVVTEGTGKAARLAESPGRRSAGKTGTTDEYRDAWFVGFTTDIVAGIWVGNDDNSPTDRVTGGDIPARIWHDFVSEAERILARPNIPAPAAGAPAGSATRGPATSGPAISGPAPSEPAPGAPTTAQSGTAAAPPATAASPTSSGTPSGAMPPPVAPTGVRGVPVVVDTATLRVDGAIIHLNGVAGEAGVAARDLASYIGGREVACEPADRGVAQFRCTIGDYDLGEAIVLNGAGRADGDAPERLRGAEEQARRAGRGIWGR